MNGLLVGYIVGGVVWFLTFLFIKEWSLKRSALQGIFWPYFMVRGVRYWTKRRSFMIQSSDFVNHLDEIRDDPNYDTTK